ncbi:Dabb family protein [Kitasatospora viridis]|uniref:Stress responsive alpha/beta barrel protein n=1 Tax=Kitasatospora viridis TaxID=281105 RepID=A0A561TSW5_9ACTN|nr:Dabb family protein [Kitasatospora viridis]TWF90209.1 stress responsive alpha/beta barrel protein [Kitasatospora viridis]
MIRHIVLFKFKDGISWEDPRAQEAERIAVKVGGEVPELREWRVGRNISTRPVAYDFAAVGLMDDEDALERYLVDEFHQKAIRLWREISDWVIADVVE